ncbi:hypothetical protein AB0952_09290 [Streptomyces caniferus]|uniref:hypothetical protein n=1 Tax=Streptomyces caniferus TaxID=285557 RepID=UPI003456C7F0
MSVDEAQPDLALAVNVGRRWPEVEDGASTEADVVLSAWSPWSGRSKTKMHFDPDRIAVVVGCRDGQTMAVFDVLPDEEGLRWRWVNDGPRRRRIAFHGRPSKRYAAQLAAPAPKWRQGEGKPVKVLALTELLQGDAPADNSARRAVLGEAVVTTDGDRQIAVSVPADYTVVIHTRTPAADRDS